jgi:hypothetical protein
MDEQAPAAYPKMLYRGGKPYGENGRGVPGGDTRVVRDSAEEAEAREEGFEPAFQGEPHAPPAEAEPQEPGPPVERTDEPNSLSAAIEYLHGQDNPAAGADTLASEPGADADGDGHDDETGEFVAPQPRKKRK